MTYEQTLDFLYTQLPMYQRVGKKALKADLSNTIKLLDVLGNPHLKFKSVHIAGPMEKEQVPTHFHPFFRQQDIVPDFILRLT